MSSKAGRSFTLIELLVVIAIIIVLLALLAAAPASAQPKPPAVPDAVLEAAARRRDPRFPEVSGRLCRLPDGRIGRFGWKAQEATLEGFVLTACAEEGSLRSTRSAARR